MSSVPSHPILHAIIIKDVRPKRSVVRLKRLNVRFNFVTFRLPYARAVAHSYERKRGVFRDTIIINFELYTRGFCSSQRDGFVW